MGRIPCLSTDSGQDGGGWAGGWVFSVQNNNYQKPLKYIFFAPAPRGKKAILCLNLQLPGYA